MIPADLLALANHLWQSTLFAAAAWLLTVALRKNRAAVRYGIWLAASVKFLVPFSLLVNTGSQFGWRPTPWVGPVPVSHVVEQVSRPFVVAAAAASASSNLVSTHLSSIWLLSVWVGGFAVSMAIWWRLWRRFHTAVRMATPLRRWDLPIPVMTSPAPLAPSVFGIRRPVLLLPEGIMNRLAPEQLRSILAHELCHVRRHDNLTASLHMLVESVFWFHPLVWWIGGRLVEERERACDEEVVRLGHEPAVYAEGILNVCKFCLQSPSTCASGVTGANLKKRIEAIMNSRSQKLTTGRKLLLAAVGIVALGGPVLAGILAQNSPQSPIKRIRFEAVPALPETPAPSVTGPTIEAIEFRGTRVPHLRALITSRAGGVYDAATLRRDAEALTRTGSFSSVIWEAEPGAAGMIVRFLMADRPLIRFIEYRGDDTVTIAEILERFRQRSIRLQVETLYDEAELGRAAATIQELVAERGRQDIAITALVQPIAPGSSVKITFRAMRSLN